MNAIRADVRRFHSPDVDDLNTYTPAGDEFEVLVQILVGPVGSDGEESFDVLVCSPARLAARAATGPFVCEHTVVCGDFDWPAIRELLLKRVQGIEGSDWVEVALQVGRIGRWEFEGYH